MSLLAQTRLMRRQSREECSARSLPYWVRFFFRGLEFSNCSLFSKMYFFFRLLLDASFHCDLYSSIVPPAPQRTTYSPDSLIKSRTTKGPHSIMYSFGKAIVAETFFSFAIHGSAVGQNVNCNFLFIIARPAHSAPFYK